MVSKAFKIKPSDNVATVLDDVRRGYEVEIVGRSSSGNRTVVARAEIGRGHKIAVATIKPGETILKFGVPIGTATAEIVAGDWVHLQNLRSNYDERSQTFDRVSGLSSDVVYE